MGSTAGDISEFVRRFCEISGPVRFTDAEPFALFGHAVRGYEQMQDAPAQYAVRRAAFREAYRLMGDLTALLGAAWTDLLDQAAADLPVTADDAEWAAEQERAGTQPRDRAAGHTFHALRDAGHGGDSRGLAQLFVLTQPGEGRAAAWLRGVGAAIARGVAAMPAETSD